MFLRKNGRRIYLLHSYRDGRGQVCQRRVGNFVDSADLERQLADLPTRCPEIASGDLSKLRGQAEDLLAGIEVKPARGAERIRRATRTLLRLLAEENADTLSVVSGELQTLKARLCQTAESHEQASEIQAETEEKLRSQALAARSRLSPRRRRLDPTEATALPHVIATYRLADFLSRQGRLQESAEVFEQLVCPTAATRLAYGAVLHKLGRRAEALEQYSRVPRAFAYRHYNSASACWEEGRPEEALVHLLHGLMREPQVVEALERSEKGLLVKQGGVYWEIFGDLWTSGGRRFVLNVCSQLIVKWRLREALARGVQVRNLVPVRSRAWFLAKVLKAN